DRSEEKDDKSETEHEPDAQGELEFRRNPRRNRQLPARFRRIIINDISTFSDSSKSPRSGRGDATCSQKLSCPDCDAKFRRRDNLRSHIRRKHRGHRSHDKPNTEDPKTETQDTKVEDTEHREESWRGEILQLSPGSETLVEEVLNQPAPKVWLIQGKPAMLTASAREQLRMEKKTEADLPGLQAEVLSQITKVHDDVEDTFYVKGEVVRVRRYKRTFFMSRKRT
ncbi:uncharacterized protein LOC117117088, partial [Anneissia japonica]|uniref:uncharacterized protein LOC117117088 n=1 Tax=Anneissia japonica TaxID=1529436 RepID=UPI001425673F